jgi:cytoskeletal protein CcmA (bactofilin family)
MFGKKESTSNTDIKNVDRLDTFIGRSTNIKGNISAQSSIRIDGQLEGNVNTSETIITGPESLIKGNVSCKEAVIAGRIEGNILASENVELQSGANILGDITCGNLVIGKNCFFDGKCNMSGTQTEKI